MPNKLFLETYPLYRKFYPEDLEDVDIDEWTRIGGLPKPAIHTFCPKCSSDQTFTMRRGYADSGQNLMWGPEDYIWHVVYQCSSCNKFSREFFLKFDYNEEETNSDGEPKLYVMKIGQFPSWKKDLDKELLRQLGNNAELYEKAVTCESTGYGIGAYAYFRRIAETIIDELLALIPDLMHGEEKAKYQEVLEETKKTHDTTEKIELVKDLLPPTLQPQGLNPLGILHSALSEGLHERTDEECLKDADKIKQALVFLVNQIIRSRNDAREFSDSLKALLEEKNTRTKAKNQNKQNRRT